MNHTAILSNTTMNNPKKANDCDKFTENTLCDEIHNNFRVLAMVCPLSDEFRAVFEKGMFLKSNPKAFPHAMKYLFTICDSIEFKKSFCWPIYNKAAEASFRNSTLDLLNKLNAQYGLGFGEIKFKILIFPGGMEFMRVIFELTKLSMQLILKRNGISHGENLMEMSLVSVQKHLDGLEDVCNFVMDYKKKVEECSVQLKSKTSVLTKLLEKVIANTNITAENILYDKFAERWEEVHEDILKRAIEPEIRSLMQFQDKCQKLDEKINGIFKQHTIDFDEHALSRFSMEMQKFNLQQQQEHHHQMSNIVENGRINLENLLPAFQFALPLIQQSMECYKPRSIDAMAYESNQLQKLSKKSNELLQHIQQINESINVEQSLNNQTAEQYHAGGALDHIKSMILTTPTISQDVVRRAECAAIQSKRLVMLEDAYQSRPTTTILMHNRPLNSISEESRNNSQCEQKQFASPARLFAKESKSKLDPMAMLSTITKKLKPDKHVGSGAFRPRSMNFGLQTGIGGNSGGLHGCSRINDTILSVPDFSSTLLMQSSSDVMAIEQINASLINQSISKNDPNLRSFMAVDLSKSDLDLNCSPSGRIESLVSSKLQCSGVKPIKADDMESNEQMQSPYEPPMQRRPIDSNAFNKHMTRDLSNIENNQNAPNKGAFNLNKMIDNDDESLLNMSDEILNDIALDDSDLR